MKKYFNFKSNTNLIVLIIIIILVLIFISFDIILYNTTHFEKKITIQDKYTRYRNKSSNYNLVDIDNNIYKVDNLWFRGDFNRADEYVKTHIGKTYLVKGYGKRVPFLAMYKKIYDITPINN